MKQNNILLTGYKSINEKDLSPSKEVLNKITNKINKFLFTNDFKTIDEEVKEILKYNYEYIIMIGWKPNIKKISIEIASYYESNCLYTNILLEEILKPLKKHNIAYSLSENPGTSYCNHAYYEVLNNIKKSNLKTKAIFIHIPALNNFGDMDKFISMLNSII